jgi:hypothetical protein
MITVDVNAADVEESLGELARKLGITMRDMVVEQSRLTAQGLLHRTPPIGSNMRISAAAGKGAISSDLYKVFDTVQRREQMGNIVVHLKDGRLLIRNPTSKRKGRIISADRVGVKWPLEQMRNHHSRQRGLRSGRVMGGSAADVAFLKNKTDFNRYRKTVYARMGKLAAGWLPALRHFAAKSKVSKGMRVPAFVLKAPGNSGSFQDHTGASSPYSIITNVWRYGYPRKMQDIYRVVLRERALDATGWMYTRLRRLMRNR